MSFGILNELTDKAIKIIKKTNIENASQLFSMKTQIFNELKKDKKYDNITMTTIDEIFSRITKTSYSFKNICFDNGKNSFREFEDIYFDIYKCDDVIVPPEYINIEKQFNKLKLLPQPAQRSKEWFDYRYNRITASDTASAIDQNPYEPVESFILKKCDPNFPFLDNDAVYHGKKYEPIATMIYEHIYNSRVYEFGALPSEKYNFLGASPDGICSKLTLDNKFSDRIGTMLEIKCPVTRDIHTSGNIMGDICPFYYYCQVQQQLACCELEKCDFWQCKLSEYNNKEEYLLDDCSNSVSTINNDSTKIEIDDRLKKGAIIEFYPKKFTPEFDEDKIMWKSKYIIPKRVDMNAEQYDSWILKTINDYKTLYPEIDKDYYFNRIIYWKLDVSHNVTINYDEKFMLSIIPVLKDVWAKIVYYRKNLNKLDELKAIVEKRKTFIRFKTSYTIHNNKIINDKILFLDDTFNIKSLSSTATANAMKKNYFTKTNNYNSNNNKVYLKKKEVDYESDRCEFIDDEVTKPKIKKVLTKVPKEKVIKNKKERVLKIKTNTDKEK